MAGKPIEKPTAFNYRAYCEAIARIEELEAELEGWKEIANTQRIRIRILESEMEAKND